MWGPTKEATSWSFPSLTSLIVYRRSPALFYTPNLTYLKFWNRGNFANTDELTDFLEDCPLLEHINIPYDFELEIEPDLVVSLPNLRTYTQTSLWKSSFLTVFNVLSFPSFCSITLRLQSDDEPTPVGYMLPPFENSDYLTEIKRVKLKAKHSVDRNEVVETLELVNAKGTKVCSEIAVSEEHEQPGREGKPYVPNVAHLNLLRSLDGRSVEILCIDGYTFRDVRGVALEFLKEALGFWECEGVDSIPQRCETVSFGSQQKPGHARPQPMVPVDTHPYPQAGVETASAV